jgi:tetratricopeptide (TPR) repeat protein
MTIRSLLLAALALVACTSRQKSPSSIPSPLSQSALPTNDPDIASKNLDAQIEGLEKVLDAMADAEGFTKVALLHLLRARLFGRVSDYERAAELGERAVEALPRDGESYVLRARTRAALHKFDLALEDLDSAEKWGAPKTAVMQVRATILQALGRPEEALELMRAPSPERKDTASTCAMASAYGDLGSIATAEKLFAEAQLQMRDTSPFPLAELYFQEGLMFQREGNLERARVYFEAAIARLPRYATAIAHLAFVLQSTDHQEAAIRLLRPAAETSEDPELAGLLATMVKGEEGQRHLAHARAKYGELMRLHPEAYANHAARFWLGAGDDPAKALSATKIMLASRKTPEAFELALNAAMAAHQDQQACAIADEAVHEKETPKNILLLARLAYDACGNGERSATMSAALAK